MRGRPSRRTKSRATDVPNFGTRPLANQHLSTHGFLAVIVGSMWAFRRLLAPDRPLALIIRGMLFSIAAGFAGALAASALTTARQVARSGILACPEGVSVIWGGGQPAPCGGDLLSMAARLVGAGAGHGPALLFLAQAIGLFSLKRFGMAFLWQSGAFPMLGPFSWMHLNALIGLAISSVLIAWNLRSNLRHRSGAPLDGPPRRG